ncbi:MAG: 4-hydroxy-tetrahydrodipicolinate synthase [Opitutales bacterium]
MSSNPFSGVLTALITPMQEGVVDYSSLEKLVERQVAAGINGIVAVGTTGESPTLSTEEHLGVIRAVIKTVDGRVPVIAGTGANATGEAVHLTKEADAAGADAMLQVTPYYNKPNQAGLIEHFAAVARVTEKPIILYSVPARTAIEVAPETAAHLYEQFPHICGIKEASESTDRVTRFTRLLGPDYLITSGNDNMTLPFMACGAHGVISVASNFFVRDLVAMVEAAAANDFDTARATHQRFAEVFRLLFVEPNPVPVKHVLAGAGVIASPEVRLPLAPLNSENARNLEAAVEALSA